MTAKHMPETKQIADMATMLANVEFIKQDVKEIKDALKGEYVSKEEFAPIKKIVYGLIGLILTAVVGALLALIIKG